MTIILIDFLHHFDLVFFTEKCRFQNYTGVADGYRVLFQNLGIFRQNVPIVTLMSVILKKEAKIDLDCSDR